MAPFVGRDQELDRARYAIERAVSADGAVLLLTGEPGIGKTRFAEQAAALAANRGLCPVWGRCWEAGGAPAYWPWIQVFRSLGGAEHPFSGIEATDAREAQQARFRVFDEAVRQLSEHARRSPLAVVLDDLHAADVPSLLLLQLLARTLRGTRIVVIGTYRVADLRLSRDVRMLLAKISRESEVVPLGRLSRDAVENWIREVSPSAPERMVADVQRVSEGNPLFVEEVLRLGATLEPARLGLGMRAILDEHLERVGDETRSLLGVAAVLGREFSPVELAELSGLDLDSIDLQLRHACDAGLTTPAEPERYAFSHIMLRDRLYSELLPSRRAKLHWAAGALLLARGDHARGAHHLLEGHGAGSLERALESAHDSALRALALLAFEDAIQIAERALGLICNPSQSRPACELHLLLAQAHFRAGQGELGRTWSARAAAVAEKLDAPDLLGRAALAYGTELISGAVDDTMVALLRTALAKLRDGDTPMRAQLMARLAAALVPPREEDMPEVDALARGAVEMARRIGDAETLLMTLQYAGGAYGYRISTEERYVFVKEIVALALALNDRGTLMRIGFWYTVTLLERGQRAEAEAAVAAHRRLIAEYAPHQRWRIGFVESLFSTLDGRLEEAATLGDQALAEAKDAPQARMAWALQRIALSHARGDPSSIAPEAARVLQIIDRVPAMRPYTAWLYAALGDREQAVARLELTAKEILSFPWLIIAADACNVLGDAELAERFYEPLSAHNFENRIFWGPAGSYMIGPTAKALGDLARLMGRRDAALRHYDEAIAFCERIGAKPALELCRRAREGMLGKPACIVDSAPPAPPRLARDGDLWAFQCKSGEVVRLKDSKGLQYLHCLLNNPGRELHVLELIGSDEAPGDAGPLLDARAKDEYKRRLEDLNDQLEEAHGFGDRSRATRVQAEIDAIADELANAVGLGGRDRRAASNVERARINVQRRLKDAIDRITQQDPALGRYLGLAVKTGTYCSFTPV